MALTNGDVQRPLVVAAARRLVESARAERAAAALHDPTRWFYLGVEAAALEQLHPELSYSRSDDWLDREPRAFREGYLRTTIMLAAGNAGASTARCSLPAPPKA